MVPWLPFRCMQPMVVHLCRFATVRDRSRALRVSAMAMRASASPARAVPV